MKEMTMISKAFFTTGLLCAASLALAGPEAAAAPPSPASAASGNGEADRPDAATLAKEQAETQAALAAMPVADRDMCLIPGRPAEKNSYQVLKKLKVARQTYGSVTLVLPELVSNARAAGGDAIIDYNGAQHFGFFPWRLVRPIATGTAIHWTGPMPLDCAAYGGKTLAAILASHKAPDEK